jgi:hypothetical protein
MDNGTSSPSVAAEIAATMGDPFCRPRPDPGRHVRPRPRPARAHRRERRPGRCRTTPSSSSTGTIRWTSTRSSWPTCSPPGAHGRSGPVGTIPTPANYLLIWNCLWRAGGSIVHGHAQALLGRGPHYARLERFRRDAASYAAIHHASLVSDLVALHRDLELAVVHGDEVSILAHITPLKEREVIVAGPPGGDERDPTFADAVARALLALRDRLGVRSFNLALWRPPLSDDGPARGWEGVGPIVRIVDRGDPASRPRTSAPWSSTARRSSAPIPGRWPPR